MMTNDELKKKILEIFEKAIGDWYEKDDGLFAEGYTPEEGDNRLKAFMADALIAAGISDTKAAVIEFAGVLRDKISREHSLGTKGYIVGFKEMKERALADVDALVKEVCGDEPNDDRLR